MSHNSVETLDDDVRQPARFNEIKYPMYYWQCYPVVSSI